MWLAWLLIGWHKFLSKCRKRCHCENEYFTYIILKRGTFQIEAVALTMTFSSLWSACVYVWFYEAFIIPLDWIDESHGLCNEILCDGQIKLHMCTVYNVHECKIWKRLMSIYYIVNERQTAHNHKLFENGVLKMRVHIVQRLHTCEIHTNPMMAITFYRLWSSHHISCTFAKPQQYINIRSALLWGKLVSSGSMMASVLHICE